MPNKLIEGACTVNHSILADLHRPHPAGQDLALYRTRAYRFTDDVRHYVLAEELEERHIGGSRLTPQLSQYVKDCLDSVRTSGRLPEFDLAVTDAAGIDVNAGVQERERLRQPGINTEPRQVVAIVGAPRSGTSHLYNLLAYHGSFAYFTTVSCWAWPIWNLTRPVRRLFTEIGEEVFAVDNKNTRLVPSLVMPYEAEDIHARAMPTYRHIAHHRYELHSARLGNVEILTRAVSAHLEHFGLNKLLTKSPFNSLRIPLLERLWGSKIRYLYIVRDRHETADSMRRNHFAFDTAGRSLSAGDAWTYFNDTIRQDLPGDRHLIVDHAGLRRDPKPILSAIVSWLGAETHRDLPRCQVGPQR